MRKTFVVMVMLLILTSAAAANASMPYPPYYESSPGDYYKVQFDGEGEASVMARISTLNFGKEPIKELVLEIPGNYVRLRYAFQEKGWEQFNPLDYQEEVLSKSTKYTIRLENPIEPGQTGTILMNYKAVGYIRMGVNFDFDFETIKKGTDIDKVRVAVSVDPDLYLRGGETRVDYRSDFSGFAGAAQAVSEDSSLYSQELRSYSDGITYASGYVRTKSNLDPWESFHVTGSYNWANLWFLTYIWEIAGAVLVLIAIKLLLFRRIRKMPRWRLPRDRFTRIGATGFLTAAALLAVWWGVAALMDSVFYWFNWFAPLLLLASGLVILIIFFAPAYAVGRKHGVNEGIWTLASTIIWLFVLIGIMAALSIGVSPPIYY